MTEAEFIAALRALPLHLGAAGLGDDVATLAPGNDTLVLSTDTMVEGVHFPAAMAAADVAWRLVACALSDLAAKGAEPVGGAAQLSVAGFRQSRVHPGEGRGPVALA